MQEADQIRSIKQIYDLVFQINLSLSQMKNRIEQINKFQTQSIDRVKPVDRSTTFFIISFFLTFKRNRIE